MAKRSKVQSIGADPGVIEATVLEQSEDVGIVLLIDARVIVAGHVTGRQYVWEGAGAEVKVAKEDAEEILSKRYGGCCGGSPSPRFQLVEV